MNEKIPYKIYLTEDEIPTQWYNVRADMKNKPAPLINPGTGKPLTLDDLNPIFCEDLNKQAHIFNNSKNWNVHHVCHVYSLFYNYTYKLLW